MYWSPPQLCGRMQLLITSSPGNMLAQLDESAATQSLGCSACTQGQTIQHVNCACDKMDDATQVKKFYKITPRTYHNTVD